MFSPNIMPITTKVVSSNPVNGEVCVLHTTLCDKSLSVTYDRSVVFSGYAGFLQKSN